MSDTTSEKRPRPLSPHLQVYRLPYNAVMSISGRAAGIGLFFAVSVIMMWFVAVVWNPAIFALTMEFLAQPAMQYISSALLLLGAFIVFFYIGNGIRHVLWDMVIGVNVKFGVMTGHAVLVVAALLTIGIGCAVFSGAQHNDGVSPTFVMNVEAQP